MSLPPQLRGVVTPLLTPLAEDGGIDVDGLHRLIEHVIAGGVAGVFVLGTTGEGPALTVALRREVVTESCKAANGRVPVLVGIADSALGEAVALSEFCASEGADAVVTTGPTYFPVSQAELQTYVRKLAGASPLPVFLYNMPSHAHVAFSADTVMRVADLPGVAGLKDSSGDIMYLQNLGRLLGKRDDFTLMVGPEEMLADAVLLGIHGGVNGGSNLFPELYVALYEAASAGDVPKTRALHDLVLEVSRRLYCTTDSTSSYLRGIKCAASQLGLCRNVLAAPYAPFEGAQVDAIRNHLHELRALEGIS